jgi:hypothetical protein
LTAISPAPTAPVSAARSVAWIRCSVAALTGRPSTVSPRMTAVNMDCTSPGVRAASRMPPRYGTRLTAALPRQRFTAARGECQMLPVIVFTIMIV